MLTSRQKEVLDFVEATIATRGIAPTHEEIAEDIGLKSLATVHEHLQALEKKGYVRKLKGQARGMEVTMPAKRLIPMPLFSDFPTEKAPTTQAPIKLKPISRFAEGKKNGLSYEILHGDAIDIIPRLKREYTTIYLDPPFNSNRAYAYSASGENFGFSDRWAEGEYEQWIDRLLSVCRSKLAKDGTLFFHISAELSLSPHFVLQKHFKKVEPIFWKKAHGKNTVRNKMGSVIDIIYKASNNGSKFNLQYVPLDAYYFENSYTQKDSRGFYALGSLKHDKTRKGHMYEITRNGITYTTPYGWKISKERLLQLMKEDRIHFARPKPGMNISVVYKKLYKHETKGKPLSNLWDDIAYITRTTKDQRLYPTQKPMDLLKRIVALSSDEGDWVLDPVAGSGTTGAAALALGRNTTLIDINKDAAKIAKKRLIS